MLSELTINDFAIIDRLQLGLRPGLVIFTGETGAGKSIIIDAVELLMGGRSDPGLVRAGADVARLEGVFSLEPAVGPAVRDILAREALLDEDYLDEIVLSREVRREGRSVSRVNGRM